LEVGSTELFRADSDRLVIAFTAHRMGPRFGFYAIAKTLGANVLFVRDARDCWYNTGVDGLGSTVEEIAASLAKVAEEVGAKRVVTLGSSMGGYAAILFGCLLNAERCVAFAPQTLLQDGLPLTPPKGTVLQAPDLADLPLAAPGTQVEILVGGDSLPDLFHAGRMRGENVRTSVMPGQAHTIAEALAARHEMQAVVHAYVDGKTHPSFWPPPEPKIMDQICAGVHGAFLGDGGIAPLQELVRLQPYLASGHYFLGRALARKRRWAEAEAACAEAVQLKPEWYEPYRYGGEAVMRQGRLEEALFWLRWAVELRDEWGAAHYFLGECLYRLGLFEAAERALDKANALEPHTIVLRARLMQELGVAA
jgi:pimeloyl-ACP methyl ester carboxylesterase